MKKLSLVIPVLLLLIALAPALAVAQDYVATIPNTMFTLDTNGHIIFIDYAYFTEARLYYDFVDFKNLYYLDGYADYFAIGCSDCYIWITKFKAVESNMIVIEFYLYSNTSTTPTFYLSIPELGKPGKILVNGTLVSESTTLEANKWTWNGTWAVAKLSVKLDKDYKITVIWYKQSVPVVQPQLLSITPVSVPSVVRPGESFKVKLSVSLPEGSTVTVTVFINGKEVTRKSVTVKNGEIEVTVPAPEEEGEYKVLIVVEGGGMKGFYEKTIKVAKVAVTPLGLLVLAVGVVATIYMLKSEKGKAAAIPLALAIAIIILNIIYLHLPALYVGIPNVPLSLPSVDPLTTIIGIIGVVLLVLAIILEEEKYKKIAALGAVVAFILFIILAL